MVSAKQPNLAFGNAPTNLDQVREPPIYLTVKVAQERSADESI
jgi:hypothetical protein